MATPLDARMREDPDLTLRIGRLVLALWYAERKVEVLERRVDELDPPDPPPAPPGPDTA